MIMSSWLSNLVPPADSRLPLSPHLVLTKLVPPLLAYYVTAVLAILPGTSALRLAILPLTLWLAFQAVTSVDIALTWNEPGFKCFDFGLGLNMVIIAMRAIEWTIYREPLCKNDTSPPRADTKSPPTLTGALWDACDLTTNFRGVGWNWSQGFRFPTERRSTESTPAFLAQTILSAVIHFAIFDACVYSVGSFSPSTIGSPAGGTIFDPALPPLARYARSSVITLLAGIMFYAVIQGIYDINTVNFIILFRQRPAQWPPLYDAPWKATSVAQFWAKGWHQLFRSSFVSVGARPLSFLIGRVGGVLGAFLLSGILHDWGMWAMARGTQSGKICGFFLMMGIGCILEALFRKAAGVRVQGWWGRSWTMMWIVGWGNLLVDAWARIGLLGSNVVPNGTGAVIRFFCE